MTSTSQRTASRRSALKILFGSAGSAALHPYHFCCGAPQQIDRDKNGMNVLHASNMKLVTDLPIDDELMAWPGYLEQALLQWQKFFAPPTARVSAFTPAVYLVGDKNRWESLGLLNSLPTKLADGYQLGLDLYVAEQPSPYYRRLLFLHEATHAVMYLWQGGTGSPWMAEGLADYLGTHRIIDDKIQLGFFPDSPEQVPHWGRIRLIKESIEQGTAPTLTEIIHFPDMQTDRMLRYAWSWALCTFLLNHPDTKHDFQTLYRGQLDYSMRASQAFEAIMRPRWNKLSIQWRCFVDDLSFGMDLVRLPLNLKGDTVESYGQITQESLRIAADRGWQVAPGVVESGTQLTIQCTGQIIVRKKSAPNSLGADSFREPVVQEDWKSEPAGITIEYVNGNPLGSLVGTWAPIEKEQPSAPWVRFKIGSRGELQPPTERSILLLRVNDRPNELLDNVGEFEVKITPRD